MCNIGHNPTVKFQDILRLEVNIFSLDEDLYGKNIEIFFKQRIRGEIKFQSLDELKRQLSTDKVLCISYSLTNE
jgi:riboflavin kinase/FMN adenylyltransferase